MKQTTSGSLVKHFSILSDPRRPNHNTKRHNLIDIVVITILAVICGAGDWPTIIAFGKKKGGLNSFWSYRIAFPLTILLIVFFHCLILKYFKHVSSAGLRWSIVKPRVK